VIREAMNRKGMVALGRLVMSTRERICGIEIEDQGLRLTTLRTAEEVRDIAQMPAPPLPKPDPQMLSIAEKIVEQQAGEFEPDEFVDRYEDALRAMIEEKKKGHIVKPERVANDDGKVVDLMAALRASLGKGPRDNSEREQRAAAHGRGRDAVRRGPAAEGARRPKPRRGGRSAA
jgi:DNA end-binding protein Ku